MPRKGKSKVPAKFKYMSASGYAIASICSHRQRGDVLIKPEHELHSVGTYDMDADPAREAGFLGFKRFTLKSYRQLLERSRQRKWLLRRLWKPGTILYISDNAGRYLRLQVHKHTITKKSMTIRLKVLGVVSKQFKTGFVYDDIFRINNGWFNTAVKEGHIQYELLDAMLDDMEKNPKVVRQLDKLAVLPKSQVEPTKVQERNIKVYRLLCEVRPLAAAVSYAAVHYATTKSLNVVQRDMQKIHALLAASEVIEKPRQKAKVKQVSVTKTV